MRNSHSLASKVAKARDEAGEAVTRCDAARGNAIRDAGLVVAAGNDVARRDAAALTARHASVRCAAASSAAREVAIRSEAVAAEVAALNNPANLGNDAAFAAQQARDAAARCDVEGVVAASEAAIAFAASCVAASDDAAAPTLAAREAAARCVLARDDEVTALLVAQKVPWRDFPNSIYLTMGSSADHEEARKDAVAAALAARKAALRCAAASRRAVSAASVARDAATRCDAAGGDGAPAREAANLCVAARAGATAGLVVPPAAAGPCVPRADAAAVEARHAAFHCDEALDGGAAHPDKQFLDKMRGWLMTVAVLFVGIAFQGVIQPPLWLSSSTPSGAPSAAPDPGPFQPCVLYFNFHTLTMAMSLTMLVVLLTIKKVGRNVLYSIQFMMVIIAMSVAGSFIIATSQDLESRLNYLFGFVMYAILALVASRLLNFLFRETLLSERTIARVKRLAVVLLLQTR